MLMKFLGNLVPQDRDVDKKTAWLSQFAIDVRYPAKSGVAVSRKDADRALDIARRIKDLCKEQLADDER